MTQNPLNRSTVDLHEVFLRGWWLNVPQGHFSISQIQSCKLNLRMDGEKRGAYPRKVSKERSLLLGVGGGGRIVS